MNIKCPTCKRQKDLILEQPSWSGKNRDNIEIQCHCCNCGTEFFVEVTLKDVVKVYDIELKKEYPF